MCMQNINPKISVITPAYNTEKYIKEAIESILRQTFTDFEFIIVDDCSTDKTWEIIQNYAKMDSRIVASRNEKNLGIAENRNKGISLARGKYIVWQDSDDISFPNRLEKQYEFMENNLDVGICGGYLQFFNEKGDQSIRKYAPDDARLRKTIFRYAPLAQPAAIVRKKCFDQCGRFNSQWTVSEDLDVSFRIGDKYKFANLQEVVIRYRENNTSATFSRLKDMELYTIAIRKKYSRGYSYTMTLADKIYNFLHYVSIYLIPARAKIWLFVLLRNSK